jgi:chromosome partitioning protein
MPLKIAVLNQKGGVGKSTVAQNLAAAAHLAGRKTLVLDLDSQGTTFDWYATRAQQSKLRGLDVRKADKVWSLPQFDEMTAGHDVVICDGPARLSDVCTAAAVASDLVLVPMKVGKAEWWAAAETGTMLDVADNLRRAIGRAPVRRLFVLNDAFKQVKDTVRLIEALDASASLLPVVLHHRVAYMRALGDGESVLTTEPEGEAAREVRALFHSIMSIGQETPHAA